MPRHWRVGSVLVRTPSYPGNRRRRATVFHKTTDVRISLLSRLTCPAALREGCQARCLRSGRRSGSASRRPDDRRPAPCTARQCFDCKPREAGARRSAPTDSRHPRSSGAPTMETSPGPCPLKAETCPSRLSRTALPRHCQTCPDGAASRLIPGSVHPLDAAGITCRSTARPRAPAPERVGHVRPEPWPDMAQYRSAVPVCPCTTLPRWTKGIVLRRLGETAPHRGVASNSSSQPNDPPPFRAVRPSEIRLTRDPIGTRA